MRDRRLTGIAFVGVIILAAGYVWDLFLSDATVVPGLLIVAGTVVASVGLAGIVLERFRER